MLSLTAGPVSQPNHPYGASLRRTCSWCSVGPCIYAHGPCIYIWWCTSTAVHVQHRHGVTHQHSQQTVNLRVLSIPAVWDDRASNFTSEMLTSYLCLVISQIKDEVFSRLFSQNRHCSTYLIPCEGPITKQQSHFPSHSIFIGPSPPLPASFIAEGDLQEVNSWERHCWDNCTHCSLRRHFWRCA